jgi:hypothetical protein
MATKHTIALAAVVGFFLIIGVIAALLTTGQRGAPGGNGQPSGNLPQYVLPADEERHVSEFVNLFVALYNTYTTDDLSNLPALGDYQTPDMQDRTYVLHDELEQTLPPEYSKSTAVTEGAFRYNYRSGNFLEVFVGIRVSETGHGVYEAEARVLLEKLGGKWLVDYIEINKK